MNGKEIVLGFTNTVDYETVWNASYLEHLARKHGVSAGDIRKTDRISTVKDLLCSILYHMKNGEGCGKYVENEQLLDEFVSGCEYKVTLGGTAVRAAIAVSRMGCPSFIHLVSINDDTRAHLPANVGWVCSSDHDTHAPHVVIQYPKGASVSVAGTVITAPCNNRVIYTNDADNAQLRINPAFFDGLDRTKIIVLSSFDIIQDKAILEDRLSFVEGRLKHLSPETKVFYEDACFTHAGFPPVIWKHLVPYIDIYSMNEDELQGYCGRKINLLDPGEVLPALEQIRKTIGVPVLAVHTKHWALAYGNGASSYAGALKGGITMATARYRFGDALSPAVYGQTYDLPSEEDAERFGREIAAKSDTEICCIPSVRVTETDVTTIGLGDTFVGGFVLAYVRGTPANTADRAV